MVHLENPAKVRLEKNELAIGILLRQARTVDIAKIMRTCGYDYLFIDMEHYTFGCRLVGLIRNFKVKEIHLFR